MANKNIESMKGKRFGKLRVLQFAGINQHRKRLWRCLCDCGAFVIVIGSSLRSGATSSCGCVMRIHSVTHGQSRARGGLGSPEYRVWAVMLSRCKPGVRNYGARGIKVCERWKSFENFFIDMGRRPSPRHSIDRIDNDGDYEPDNCRWATKRQQDRNRRTNHLLTLGDETCCLTEWAEIIGITPQALSDRLKSGWSIRQALTSKKGVARD